LLNKIGIAVLVIGISFGVKYAIDHQMLNPLTRIILGYVAGGILLGLALKLKKNYTAFSAVLLSGAMAEFIFYYLCRLRFLSIHSAVDGVCVNGFIYLRLQFLQRFNTNNRLIAIIGLVGCLRCSLSIE
jgi:hypothetical protein